MMLASFLGDHADSHVETVEKDAGGREGQLGKSEQNAGLNDEIDTLCSAAALIDGHHSVENGGRAGDLGVAEEPLVCGIQGHRRGCS